MQSAFPMQSGVSATEEEKLEELLRVLEAIQAHAKTEPLPASFDPNPRVETHLYQIMSLREVLAEKKDLVQK